MIISYNIHYELMSIDYYKNKTFLTKFAYQIHLRLILLFSFYHIQYGVDLIRQNLRGSSVVAF